MKKVLNLSFRPAFGHESEGNATVVIDGDKVSIGFYVWSGNVLKEAIMVAEAVTDKKLVSTEKVMYGQGKGSGSYKAVDFRDWLQRESKKDE